MNFRLDIMKNFFIKRVVKHWEGLSREVVESPSPKTSEKFWDMAFSAMI